MPPIVPPAPAPAPALRAQASFAIALLGLTLMMASASAPSPFYPALQREFGFSDTAMTGIFAIYTLVLLITLLTMGSISDHVGRRPVLSLGFALLAGSALVFEQAAGPGGLLAARALQGAACALLLSTLSTAIVDLEPPHWPGSAAMANSVVPLVGLALGALASGLVMSWAEAPKLDVFGGVIAISLGFAALVWLLPETSPRHGGLRAALRPRLGLPRGVAGPFWQAAPAILAGWATGGLYLSLGAPVVAQVFGLSSALIQAFVVTLLAATGAAACFLGRHASPRQVTLYGTTALAAGTALTLLGIVQGSFPLYLAALALAGTGFGTCFYGALRTLIPLSPPDERGALFASILTLSYLAFGLPTLIAGLALPVIGLRATVLAYGSLIVVAASVAALWRRFGAQD